jgi:hypothetical protein
LHTAIPAYYVKDICSKKVKRVLHFSVAAFRSPLLSSVSPTASVGSVLSMEILECKHGTSSFSLPCGPQWTLVTKFGRWTALGRAADVTFLHTVHQRGRGAQLHTFSWHKKVVILTSRNEQTMDFGNDTRSS